MNPAVDGAALDRLEQRVADVEEATTAEIVTVIAGRSGSYRDLAVLAGAGSALVALLLLLYLPLSFPEITVVPLTALAGVVGTLACGRLPALLGWLATEDRRRAQVRDSARIAFVDEAVSATRERTGLLIYVSVLESRIEILPDHGLDARIPVGTWNEIVARAVREARSGQWLEQVEKILEYATPVLAERFPSSEDNPDEIPNRPRVLP